MAMSASPEASSWIFALDAPVDSTLRFRVSFSFQLPYGLPNELEASEHVAGFHAEMGGDFFAHVGGHDGLDQHRVFGHSAQGQAAMKQLLRDNVELCDEIKAQVREALKNVKD